MKTVARALLAVNVSMITLLVLFARVGIPPWRSYIDDAKEAIAQIPGESFEAQVYRKSAIGHIDSAVVGQNLEIQEYRKSELFIGIACLANLVGLALLAFRKEPNTERNE